MTDLSVGEFLYQEDNELFLVCIGETENSYKFSVHGWREIDKERVNQYVDNPDQSQLYDQEKVIEVVQNEGERDEKESFQELLELFAEYDDADISEDGPHTDFALDDT